MFYEGKKIRKIFIFVLAAALTIAFTPAFVFNADASAAATAVKAKETKHYVRNGDISYPVYSDPSILMPSSRNSKAASSLPSSYDLSEMGYVTSVKDQRQYGACWSFGATAALESNLIKQGIASKSIDLSERHLAYFAYHGADSKARSMYAGADSYNCTEDSGNIDGSGTGLYNEGGNASFAIATLAREYGAANESTAPYQSVNIPFSSADMGAVSSSLKTKSVMTVKETRTYPNVVNSDGSLNNAAMVLVKQGLMKYGACSFSYCETHKYLDLEEGMEMTHPYYNVTHKAYYCTTPEADHAVTLVGWSDSFPKEYFGGTEGQQPAGNGAWLVKGSYGNRLSANGYYWISYYTPSITEITQIIGKKTPSGDLYQYDGVGEGITNMDTETHVSGANVYTARKSEGLYAVSTWTDAADSIVNVKIYKGIKSGKPTSGSKIVDKTYSRKYAGYHTLSLGKSFKVTKGQKFSVIITTKYKKDNVTKYMIPLEIGNRNGKTVNVLGQKKGESYVSNGSNWEDTYYLADSYGETMVSNALAKVYAK